MDCWISFQRGRACHWQPILPFRCRLPGRCKLPGRHRLPFRGRQPDRCWPEPGCTSQVLTAIRLLPGDTRYLPVSLENTLVSVDAGGQSAEVSGLVNLTGTGTANTLWVLASAFDSAGKVVGVRRWESTTALNATAPVAFDFPVSSVGPGIARVEFLAEARP